MTDVMLDIETFSTHKNAAIMTIGAIKFNREGKLDKITKMNTFYKRITLSSNKELNRHIDEDTLKWWEKQNDDAKFEIFTDENRISLKEALEEFVIWFNPSLFIWSHGKDFDCVIVEDALKSYNITIPWKFWNTRDTRTIFDIGEVSLYELPLEFSNKHHALYDCYRQIYGVKKAYKRLKK